MLVVDGGIVVICIIISVCILYFSFFLSWGSKTQPNHWTKWMASTRLTAYVWVFNAFFFPFLLCSTPPGKPQCVEGGRTLQLGCRGYAQDKKHLHSKDILWAFAFGSSKCTNLRSLLPRPRCPHPRHSFYDYFSISVHFFPQVAPHLVSTIRQLIWPSLEVLQRVPGLPIRDCTGSSNNLAQMCLKLIAVNMTGKTFFERLCLVPRLGTFGPGVNCPCAPTPPPFIQHLFLSSFSTTISRFPCIFFPDWPFIFWVSTICQVTLSSPSTLVLPSWRMPQEVDEDCICCCCCLFMNSTQPPRLECI